MKSNNVDMNKLKVIIEVVNEHLKKAESYRFACNITESEMAMLQGRFNIELIEEFDTVNLYQMSKKSA